MSFLSRISAIAGCAAAICFLPAFAAPGDTPQPISASRPIPGRYIVVFKNTVPDAAAESARIVRDSGGRLHHAYQAALKGFAATLPDAALNSIRNNPNVASVEQDQVVSLSQVSPQNQVTWGLDRIDQADRPLDTQYNFSQTGAGVNAFIVDTGIWSDHVEFAGRIKPGYSSVADSLGTTDCHGHGTHVSGTIGGTTWGVAKAASLIPVRVLDCTGAGAWSGVIAGVDWVAASPLRPAVANMSLSGPASSALDSAIAGAVARGVVITVAAGNSNADACTVSPAREPSAITVGATTSGDARSSFSNYGACVDIFAPGSSITSAYNLSSTSSYVMSGTSMAAPHVAGIAALVLQANPTASPAAVTSWITANATPNRLTSVGTGSPNLLANSLGGATAAPPVTQQPATITVAFKSMAGSGTRTGGNWKASAVVSVRDINSGAAVANATIAATFSPGGSVQCVTASTGSCTLTSSALKANSVPSTTLSGTGISGSLMKYDATQNTVTQIVIGKP